MRTAYSTEDAHHNSVFQIMLCLTHEDKERSRTIKEGNVERLSFTCELHSSWIMAFLCGARRASFNKSPAIDACRIHCTEQ